MTEPLLTADRLEKKFGALLVTDQCSLEVRAGEIHAFIGPNGAGKTTLVAQISGEISPDAGTLRFNGEDITHSSVQHRVERGLVRSFQIPQVFREWTALANVALAVQAREPHGFRFVRRAAADADLIEPAMACLASVDLASRAKVRVAELSHGEVRQLEIAMSLALNPRLLLLDEPMAGMGRADSRKMMHLLDRLRGGLALLLVEHDMDVVFSLSDRVTVLVAGRPIATGIPKDIQQDVKVREVYLGRERASA
jgi:branched-chain amino acid transport system ATP-binding protein